MTKLVDDVARAIAEAKYRFDYANVDVNEAARAAIDVIARWLREPSEEMIDLLCEAYSDAFEAAEKENRERYEALRSKHPDLPERTKHGAAGCQTWPMTLQALASHLEEQK